MLIEESEMQKNHTNSKGNVSESAALNAFSKAGFVVSLPFGNGAPYDLIVDTGKRLLKVQVKTGRLRGGCVLFPAQLFAVYCRENDTIYLVPTLGALAEGRLRVNSTKNNQHQHVRWAKDFEFETFLKSL